MPADSVALTVLVEALGARALPLYFALLLALLVVVSLVWALARRYTVPTDTSHLSPGAFLMIRLVLGFIVVVGAAAVFAEMAEVLGGSDDARRAGVLDQVFSDAVRRGLGPRAFQFFSAITHLADTATLTVLAVAFGLGLFYFGRRWLALAFVAAIGGNAVLNTTLKSIFERARPLHDQAEEIARGFSFPSGHSSGAVVAYGMLAYVLIRCLGPTQAARWAWPLVLLAATLAFTVGCSRVFIQAHFATDVLAGFASGSSWLAVCIGSAQWLRYYRRSRLPST